MTSQPPSYRGYRFPPDRYCQVDEKLVDRPPDTGLKPAVNPPWRASRTAVGLNLTIPTEARVDDATTGITLIEAVGARGATVVVPPTSTAHGSRHGPRSSARDHTILAVKERGRRRWKQSSGYHGQARVENAFFRYTSIIGDSLRACSPAGRGTEVVLACNILNQMTGLGRPMSYRIDR